jgi:hypothetical protein
MLVSVGQITLATVELRRFLEIMVMTIYFTDHPVEWRSLQQTLNFGFSRDTGKPIFHAARRELAYYIDYARELMSSEPSGVSVKAVDSLRQISHSLNPAVHAGELVRFVNRVPPHEKLSEANLWEFKKLQQSVFSNSCILLAAYRRKQFNRLNATARAHFDWLVGTKTRKEIRSGPFGLT